MRRADTAEDAKPGPAARASSLSDVTGKRVGIGPAVRVVLIERVANQMVVAPAMLASMSLWPLLPGAGPAAQVWGPLIGAAAAIALLLLVIYALSQRRSGGRIQRFFRDTRSALLNRRSMAAQFALGGLLLGCCLGTFYCAAQAVNATLPLLYLLALVPGVMFSLSLPISIAGWGLREATSVALWAMAGLPYAEAMASSVLYGILGLLASLPGALVLLLGR